MIRMVKLSIYLFLFQFLVVPAYSLPSDENEPLLISADKTEMNYTTGITIYTGNVIATQGTTCFQADKITTYSDDNQHIKQLVAQGKRAVFKTLPKIKQEPLIAKAKIIDYYPQKANVILLGDGEVIQSANIFRGPKIYYNAKSQLVISTPVKNERTNVIVQPKSFK